MSHCYNIFVMLQDLLPLEQLDNAKWSLKHVYLFKVRVQVCDNSMIGLVFCSVVNVNHDLQLLSTLKTLARCRRLPGMQGRSGTTSAWS